MSVSSAANSPLLLSAPPTPLLLAAPATQTAGPVQAETSKDGVAPARTDEANLIPKPAVAGTTATAAVSPEQQAVVDATALLKDSAKATQSDKPTLTAWIAANDVARQNLQAHSAFVATGHLQTPTPEEAARQLQVLADHFNSEKMGATLPISLGQGIPSARSFPELFAANGAPARELTGGFGFDAVSRSLVAKLGEPGVAPHGMAQGILQFAGVQVPAGLLPAVPGPIQTALGPQGLTFGNVCPELFTAAVGAADNKQFVQDALNRSTALVDQNPKLNLATKASQQLFPDLKSLYTATDQALQDGAAEPPILGRTAQGQPVLGPIDLHTADKNFLAIRNYYALDGTKNLFPPTTHGTGEVAAITGGDKSTLARVSQNGFDSDLRARFKQWTQQGMQVQAQTPADAQGHKVPTSVAIAHCILQSVHHDPGIAQAYPEVFGSAMKLLTAYDQQMQAQKNTQDGTGGFKIAGQ